MSLIEIITLTASLIAIIAGFSSLLFYIHRWITESKNHTEKRFDDFQSHTESRFNAFEGHIESRFTDFKDSINKKVDDFKESITKQMEINTKLLEAKLEPINEKLGNHITDTDKKIDEINQKLDQLLSQNK